ncbi:MAG: GDP-mannose 4,6-dehydratase, partial [Rhodospirillales bacterium]|nr:GDP-mannose 4,6-dehydratase [Rhodospirillales bacterium]
ESPVRDSIEVTCGDVTDSDFVREAVSGMDAVFHLAALIAIPYSYHAPRAYVRTNVEGTLNVLQAARDLSIARVVHTSTSEVYGTARHVPIREGHPLQGQSPYSASKIAADKMAEAFHLSFDLPVVTVRPFNTYGPRQSARAVIPTIISQALRGEELKLGNLTPTRDLTFVSDTVDGFVKAALADQALGRTVNLGTGREISIGGLVEMIGKLTGRTLIPEVDRERVRPDGSEVERLLADVSLAGELLNWEPSVALEDGLEMTIDWVRENLDRFREGAYVL